MRRGRFSLWQGLIAWVLCGSLGCAGDKDGEAADGTAKRPSLVWRDTPEPVEAAPISLTASDGSGLVLSALEARTVIEEPLAFTELHLTFQNPEPRRREGRFAITLPAEAAISRFAMQVGPAWQEGEVVERQRAQAIYEDYLHRKQDPALLERDAGNQFTARVFPIEPNAEKKIIVAYSEELPRGSEPYRLLLKGLPKLSDLKVEVRFGSGSATGRESSERRVGVHGALALHERDHVPSADLAVDLPRRAGALALRSSELVVARVAPLPKATPDGVPNLTVLFDTSASRALGFEAQIERLDGLLRELKQREGNDFDLRVVAFDQTQEEVYAGPASGFSMREKGRLLAREALGASDLAAALAFVAEQPRRHERMLVVSDGVITAGREDIAAIREAVARLSAHGLRRADVLAEGGIRDGAVLAALTGAGLRGTGVVLDARLSLETLVQKLRQTTHERVKVDVAGAQWWFPKTLEGVQAGDEYLVFAELPKDKPLRIALEGLGSVTPTVTEAPRPLVERALTRAKIAALTGELREGRGLGAGRAELEREIVKLSTEQRVLSDLTALLVLESPAEYARFGLDPRALTSILRVGEAGIELFDRSGRAPVDIATAQRLEDELPREGFGSLQAAEESARMVEEAEQAARTVMRGGQPAVLPDSLASKGELGRRHRESGPEDKASARAPSRSSPMPAAPAPVAQAAAPEKAKALPGSADIAYEPAGESAGLGSTGVGSGGGGQLRARSGGTLGGLGVSAPSAVAEGRAVDESARGTVVAFPVWVRRADARLHQAFGVDGALAAKVLRGTFASQARACYPGSGGAGQTERLALEFSLSDKGTVSSVFISGGRLSDTRAQACVLAAAQRLRFPKPAEGRASIQAGVEFSMASVAPQSTQQVARPRALRPRPTVKAPRIEDAYEGALAQVLEALARDDKQAARTLAEAAHARDPGDVMALIALGEALEAQGDHARAARAYGSLIDLFPSRTDLRRMAGARLERLPREHGLSLAADSYEKALAQRPDHPSAHRLTAFALLKQGQHARAFALLEQAVRQGFRWDRFEGAERILREDMQLVAAAWERVEPAGVAQIEARLAALGLSMDREPSLRFVLNWETDANDVDFHIYDGRGGHAYYMQPKLASGGSLYADITGGYGPECFAIRGKSRAHPYVLQAHYFARGPMGYGMGKLEVVEHDGHGTLRFSEHPFAIMKDKAFVQLAEYKPLAAQR